MACSYPITIRDKKRGTDINPRFILVPCGKCINCIQRKRADWSFRLLQELKEATRATFLTLTYNEENLPKNYRLQKRVLQNYFKRVRHSAPKLKYYAVGEYGTKSKRPHYHAIVYNCDNGVLVDNWRGTGTHSQEPIGFSKCDPVNEATIHYVTGYVIEKAGTMDEKTGKMIDTWSVDDIKPFAIMSKGLGKKYLKYNTKFHKSNFTTETTKEGGQKQILPRYLRDQIFTQEEKNKLVNELQKKFQKIDYSTGEIIQNLSPESEFEKRQHDKLIVKNQLKNKRL